MLTRLLLDFAAQVTSLISGAQFRWIAKLTLIVKSCGCYLPDLQSESHVSVVANLVALADFFAAYVADTIEEIGVIRRASSENDQLWTNTNAI
jgi:hypothetical protein